MTLRLSVFGPGHPFRGGIASTTTSLVMALRAEGHHARFVVPTRQYPAWLYPGGKDRDPDACPVVEGAVAEYAPLEPWTWSRARRSARARADDIWVIPYWTWAWAPWWGFLLADRRRPPVVAVVHNPSDHEGGVVRRLSAQSVLGRCDGFMTHAKVLVRQLRSSYRGTPAASHPLPPPPMVGDPPEAEQVRERMGLAENARLALFLGLIRPYKGVDLLLEAMAGLPDASPWVLVVAGEPWRAAVSSLRERAADPRVRNRVTLRLGWVPEREVEELLAAADLLILPYRSGTQSAVAPLALGRGVPVLSTRVGGLDEVVEDGVNGKLVAPGSPNEITRALIELSDFDRLSALTAGAQRSAGRFTWAGYAKALEGLIENVLERP